MEMKKLYTLLVILIVIYVGINVIPWGSDSQPEENVTAENMITVGASSFPQMENFTEKSINDTSTSIVDSSKDMTIYVSEIDNSQGISDIYNDFLANGESSSTQTIDQNGVTTYLAYNEGDGTYGANIYFNKNGQNYMIVGNDIDNADSDYFINHCKNIIDSIEINSIS